MKSSGFLCTGLLFVACTVGGAMAATPAGPDDAAKLAKIGELMDVMHMEQMVPQTTQQVLTQMQQMMAAAFKKENLPPDSGPKLEEMQKKMTALVSEKLNWQKLKSVYVKAYADTFTEEEIQGLIDFYKTPAGQAFLKKTPLLVKNSMEAMQGMMVDMMAEIPKMLEEINGKK
jgi:hypothetical protein